MTNLPSSPTPPGPRPTLFKAADPRSLAVLLAGMAVIILFGLLSTQLGMVSTVTTIFMYIVIAQGWNILGGYGGYLNLGMAVFFGLGAYTTGIIYINEAAPFFVAIPLAGCVAALFALIIGIPSLRLRGPYFSILTLILGFLMQTVATNAKITRGALGIFVQTLPYKPREIEQIFFFSYFVLMVLASFLIYRIENSKFGYALIAIREDEDAAAALGVRTTRVKMIGLLLGAFLGGIVGGIYAYRIGYFEPTGIFSLALSINVVLMTVVGGTGTWQGPLIGVPLITLISEFLRIYVTRIEMFGRPIPLEFNRVVFGLILIAVALFAQQGILGLFRRVRERQFSV